MARYRLTVRNGSSVSHESFGELDDAISALRAQVDEIRGDGPLDAINALRDFEPGQRVQGRLEISTGGLVRGREVGIDVMGDGSLIAYSGVVRKRRLVANHGVSPFDAVREALS